MSLHTAVEGELVADVLEVGDGEVELDADAEGDGVVEGASVTSVRVFAVGEGLPDGSAAGSDGSAAVVSPESGAVVSPACGAPLS